MPESEDLTQLREMNLKLLRQLRVGQEEIRKSVAWAKGATQLLKLKKEERSSLQSPEAQCSQDEDTQGSTEHGSQLGPLPAPRAATGDREASEQEQKSGGQEPAPQSSWRNRETEQSVSPPKSPPSSRAQGQEPKDDGRPNSASLPSPPEALDLEPTMDPLIFGVQRPFHEAESLGGPRSILTTQQWQNSKVPPGLGSQSISPLLHRPPISPTLPGGHSLYWLQQKNSLIPDESWHMKPYLGYDVIAGLLDTASPVIHKSESYFSDLQDFRKANKEECISRYPELDSLDLPSSPRNKQTPDSHQCLHCYRVNQRLFTVPLDPLATCPVCKASRSQSSPETLDHPAQVRVSVPFSTFLPPHQYPIHRRKSFDASDTMALPRHCLMGWDNIPVPSASSSALSSLDLRTSLDSSAQRTEPLDHFYSSSRTSNWSWSDPLLSMSRAIQFQLGSVAERYRSGGRGFPRP
uniref:Migration and invasion inhibitory protein n=1 Tax=Vombatus ursinus TaxID=29139 RepID=A0A4X2MAD3_VOMUR